MIKILLATEAYERQSSHQALLSLRVDSRLVGSERHVDVPKCLACLSSLRDSTTINSPKWQAIVVQGQGGAEGAWQRYGPEATTLSLGNCQTGTLVARESLSAPRPDHHRLDKGSTLSPVAFSRHAFIQLGELVLAG